MSEFDRTFTVASGNVLVDLVYKAQHRLVVVCPALTEDVANALANRLADEGKLSRREDASTRAGTSQERAAVAPLWAGRSQRLVGQPDLRFHLACDGSCTEDVPRLDDRFHQFGEAGGKQLKGNSR